MYLGPCAGSKTVSEKAVEILKKIDFIRGNVGPYLYMKKRTKGVVYIHVQVDDNLIIRNLKTIYELAKQLKGMG